MMTDLHAKNQVNIFKGLEKKVRKTDHRNLRGPNFAKKQWSATKLTLDL